MGNISGRLLFHSIICVAIFYFHNICFADDLFSRTMSEADAHVKLLMDNVIEREHDDKALKRAYASHNSMICEAKKKLNQGNFDGAYVRYMYAIIHMPASDALICEGDAFMLAHIRPYILKNATKELRIEEMFKQRVINSYAAALSMKGIYNDKTISDNEKDLLIKKLQCFLKIIEIHDEQPLDDTIAEKINICIMMQPNLYDFIDNQCKQSTLK